ncbi:hypothetical protein [Streptomyces bacillaris]|uniref:hypothetical protein n=1 Tax=Streptomyces bacillaris TaxID=68179 RepID=UPI00381E81D7
MVTGESFVPDRALRALTSHEDLLTVQKLITLSNDMVGRQLHADADNYLRVTMSKQDETERPDGSADEVPRIPGDRALLESAEGMFEKERLDDLLALKPLRLPNTLAHGESRRMYRNLGVRLRGDGSMGPVLRANLPVGWTWHRTSARWVEVRDEEQNAVIEAFYKLAPYETSTRMYLTEYGTELLGKRWELLPDWRKILASRKHWGLTR